MLEPWRWKNSIDIALSLTIRLSTQLLDSKDIIYPMGNLMTKVIKPPVRGVCDFDFVEYLVTLCSTFRDSRDDEWRRESGLNHGLALSFWEPLVGLGASKFPLSRHHVDWEILAEGIIE